jgi:transcription elongation GreA/GreB family factor
MAELEKMLFQDLAHIIEQGKQQAVVQVNSTLTLTYWQVGNRIKTEILGNSRADYEIVVTLSRQLSWSHFIQLIPLKSINVQLRYA